MPFGYSSLGFGATFSLRDNFSRTSQRIQSSFTGLSNRVTAGSAKIDAALDGTSAAMGKFFQIAAIAAPWAIAIRQSAMLSDQLADVTKTTGLTGQALADLRKELEGFDTRTNLAGLLQIAKAGGAMGVAAEGLADFTNSVDKLNVALGDQFQDPEQMTRLLIKLRNSLTQSKTENLSDDILKIGNALNFMGANSAATEGDIANIARRMSGLGVTLGISDAQIFGISTALSEMGVRAEVAGSNFPLIMAKMAASSEKFANIIGVNAGQFADMVNKDIVGAFSFFSKKATEMAPTNIEMAKLMKAVGLNGVRVAEVMGKAGRNADLMAKRIDQAGKALTNTDSVMAEFNAKNQTFGAVLDKFGKKIIGLMTKIGDAVAPILTIMLDIISPLFTFLSWLASTTVGKVLLGIAFAVSTVVVAILAWKAVTLLFTPVMAVFGATTLAAFWPITLITAGVILLTIATKKAIDAITKGSTSAIVFGNIFLNLLGPIGQVIASIANVVRAFTEFNKLAEGGKVESGLLGFFQKVGGALTGFMEIWRSFTLEGFDLSEKTRVALEKIGMLDFVLSLGAWMVKIKRFFHDVSSGVSNFFNAVEWSINSLISKFSFLTDWIQKVKDAFSGLGGIADSIGNALGLDKVADFFDISDQVVQVAGPGLNNNRLTAASNEAESLKNVVLEEKKEKESARAKSGSQTINVPKQDPTPVTSNINLMIDGETVAKVVNDVNQLSNEISN